MCDPRARSQAPPPDRGDTLIEMLLSVMLVSLGVVMIVGAVSTGAELTLAHRVLTDTDVALKRAAEHVKALPYAADAGTYPLNGITWPDGVSGVSVAVLCVPADSGSQAAADATSCAGNDTGLQLVTLRATGTGTDETTTIAKRRP